MFKKILYKLGTTGSGEKVNLAETLKGKMNLNNGFFYVDAKGDLELINKMSTIRKRSMRFSLSKNRYKLFIGHKRKILKRNKTGRRFVTYYKLDIESLDKLYDGSFISYPKRG